MMKRKILLSAAVIFAAMSLNAQTDVIQGGNMEDASKWTVLELGAGSGHEETFNYTFDTPAGGQGGCLRMTTAGGWATVAIYQQVTIKKGVHYKLSMLVKNQIELVQTYFEVTVMDNIPTDDASILAFPMRMAINSWDCDNDTTDGIDLTSDVNGNLADFSCGKKLDKEHPNTPARDTIFKEGQGDTTVVVVIKAGAGNGSDLLIDNVALVSLGTTDVKNVGYNNSMEAIMTANELRISNVNGKVSVFNVTGQVLKSANAKGQVTFSVPDLPSGIYFIQNDNKSIKVIK